MKSFLDRFRRKEGEEDSSSPTQGAPADSGEMESPELGNSDFNDHGKLLSANYLGSGGHVGANGAPSPATGAEVKAAKHDDDIVLELGDFLHRIPHQLLREGPHDTHAVLRFDLGEIADRVSRGETTIPLAELYQRMPQVFKEEVLKSDNVDIRFPWQKVIKMIGDSAAAIHGPGAGAAETLAQKLRNRRSSVAAETPTPNPATPANPTPRPGPGPRPVSWLSRPTAPSAASNPNTTVGAADPASPAPKTPFSSPESPSSAAPTPPIPVAVPNPPKAAESHAPTTPMKITPFSVKNLDLSITPVVDDPRLSREEILRARDAAMLQVARVRGDFERQIMLLQQERQSALEHRDKAFAELERQKKIIADAQAKLEFDKTLLAKTGEKSAWDRQQLQEETAALKTDCDNLRNELEALKKANESVLTTTEPAPENGEKGAPPRSQKEYKRQVDELNRRILALESNQKDRTVEIGREKEARLKAERQLAAAERSLQESADHLEKVRAEGRQAPELARWEGGDGPAGHVEELHAHIQHLTREKDEALAKLAEGGTATEAAPAHAGAAWENRALAQLEADVENYRNRIKALLQERDAALAQKEALAAQIGQGSPTFTNGDATFGNADTAAATILLERDGLAAALREAEEKLAKAEAHQGASSELSTLQAETGGKLAALEQQLRSLTEQNAILAKEKADAVARAEESSHSHVANQAATESSKVENGAGLGRLKTENERLGKERDQAQAEVDKHQSEIDAIKEQRRHDQEKFERERAAAKQSSERNTAGLRKTIETQQEVIASTTRERDELLRSREAVNGDLAQARAEQKKLAAEVQSVRADWQREHEALTGELGQTRARLEEAAAGLTKDRDALNARIETLGLEHSAFRKESAQAKSDLEQKLQKTSVEKSKLEQELTSAKAEIQKAVTAMEQFRGTAEKSQSDLQARVKVLEGDLRAAMKTAQEKDAASAKLASENKKALTKLEADHQKELEQLKAERARETGEQQTALASVIAEKERAVLELTCENDALAKEKESAIGETARLRGEGEKAAAAARELAKVVQSKEASIAQKTQEHSDLAEGHARELSQMIASHEAALASKAEELGALAEHHGREQSRLIAEHSAALAQREQQLAALAAEKDGQLASKDEALSKLTLEMDRTASEAAAEREHMRQSSTQEKEALVTAHRQHLAALTEEHDRKLAGLAATKQEALESLATEADQAIATLEQKLAQHATALRNLAEEKDAIIAQRGEVILAITAEREHKVAELTADYQRKFAEVATDRQQTVRALTQARDEAERDAANLIQRLTAASAEAERAIENLEHDRNAQLVETRMLAAALEEAREVHRTEAATFAREFRTILKQRDEALAELNQERANAQQRVTSLERERHTLASTQQEARSQAERETARIRAERDAVVQQRDDLRRRISQLIHQQRQVLDEHVSPANRTAFPVEPEVETVTAEPVVAESIKFTRPRAPRLYNVIDVAEAEVIREEDPGHHFALPRIRPITLVPPQIQTLS